MPFRWVKPLVKGLLVAVIAAALLAGGFVLFVRWAVCVDWGRRPKAEVFQSVWNRPLPAGVADLQVAGHGCLMGHTVFMRIAGSRVLLKRLVAGQQPIDAESFAVWTKYFDDDKRAVGWNDIAHIRKPAYYTCSWYKDGVGWSGAMVVDWDRCVIYAGAGMQ